MSKYGNPTPQSKIKQKSVYGYAYGTLTKEEEGAFKIHYQIIERYGIVLYYDSHIDGKYSYDDENKIFLSVATQYKSLADYKNDIRHVLSAKSTEDIPKDMDNRLLITKQELKQADLLDRFAWS